MHSLHTGHGVINELADADLAGLGLLVGSAWLLRDPEDVERAVLVWIFGIGSLSLLCLQPGVLLLQGVGCGSGALAGSRGVGANDGHQSCLPGDGGEDVGSTRTHAPPWS